jgi:hypothetical protein
MIIQQATAVPRSTAAALCRHKKCGGHAAWLWSNERDRSRRCGRCSTRRSVVLCWHDKNWCCFARRTDGPAPSADVHIYIYGWRWHSSTSNQGNYKTDTTDYSVLFPCTDDGETTTRRRRCSTARGHVLVRHIPRMNPVGNDVVGTYWRYGVQSCARRCLLLRLICVVKSWGTNLS